MRKLYIPLVLVFSMAIIPLKSASSKIFQSTNFEFINNQEPSNSELKTLVIKEAKKKAYYMGIFGCFLGVFSSFFLLKNMGITYGNGNEIGRTIGVFTACIFVVIGTGLLGVLHGAVFGAFLGVFKYWLILSKEKHKKGASS